MTLMTTATRKYSALFTDAEVGSAAWRKIWADYWGLFDEHVRTGVPEPLVPSKSLSTAPDPEFDTDGWKEYWRLYDRHVRFGEPKPRVPQKSLATRIAPTPAPAPVYPVALRVEVPALGLAYVVEQQAAPYKSVTDRPGIVTQRPTEGALVLSAHGRASFFRLGAGQEVKVLTTRGERRYRVDDWHSFQVWPIVPEGAPVDDVRFKWLPHGGWYPAASLYKSFFTGDQLVFSTCIDEPTPAWGRLFVQCLPIR